MSPYRSTTRSRQRAQRPLGLLDRRRPTRARQGLTRLQVEQLIRAQGGACALCQRPLSTDHMVDHDHRLALAHGHDEMSGCSRCVRGVLCRGCNTWLSGFRDDPEFLRRAALYAGHRRDG